MDRQQGEKIQKRVGEGEEYLGLGLDKAHSDPHKPDLAEILKNLLCEAFACGTDKVYLTRPSEN